MPEEETAHESAGTALPDAVRQRVIALAAQTLPALSPQQIPASLRRFIRFTPARRARLAASPLATALATDSDFRDHIANKVIEAAGELGQAIVEGVSVATADPIDAAAIGYLAQSPNWSQLVQVAENTTPVTDPVDGRIVQLEHQLSKAKETAKTEIDKVRKELTNARAELSTVRAQLREATSALRTAERATIKAHNDLATEKGRLASITAEHETALRKVKAQLEQATVQAESVQEVRKAHQEAEQARLGILLTTITGAVRGLSKELGIEPSQLNPADIVAAHIAAYNSGRDHVSAIDEVSRLDQLLTIPQLHVIVDGYNVTKTGFPDVTLEQQRTRLIQAVAGLAAQTRAEITVVFDGTEHLIGITKVPRGIRVLFSQGNQIADELIKDLLHAEPPGRPIAVVSSDKEIIHNALTMGAHPVASAALLARLFRS